MKAEAIKSWPQLIAERGLSVRQASLAIGKDKSYLSVVVGRARNRPDNLIIPSVDVVERLAEKLELPVSVLTGEGTRQNEKRASLEDVLAWWHSNGGRLEGEERIIDSLDLIAAPFPEDKRIKPLRVGHSSLAGAKIGTELGQLNAALDDLTEEQSVALTEAFRKSALKGGSSIEHSARSMSVRKPGGVETTNYISVRLPCACSSRGVLVANYCF